MAENDVDCSYGRCLEVGLARGVYEEVCHWVGIADVLAVVAIQDWLVLVGLDHLAGVIQEATSASCCATALGHERSKPLFTFLMRRPRKGRSASRKSGGEPRPHGYA